MNVFILCAGRCGSVTFTEACRHMVNYTAGHESIDGELGRARFNYPENHIEADPRLAWMLGRLDAYYGDDAFYVHLARKIDDVAASHTAKIMASQNPTDRLILNQYAQGIVRVDKAEVLSVAHDYVHTVASNIELFLKDKTNVMRIGIENATEMFPQFWERIGAQGNLGKALEELKVRHNAT